MKLSKRRDENGSFCIGNMFVESFIKDLSGEAVKLYLFLRYRQSEGLDIGSQIVMEKLKFSPEVLASAFKELTKLGLVEISGDEMLITEDSRLMDAKTEAVGREFVKLVNGPDGPAIKKEYEDLVKAVSNTFFDGKMGRQWYDLIELCETIYRFKPEVIYLLFATCMKKEGSSRGLLSYAKKVAENWHDNGITDEESVQNYEKGQGENWKFVDFVSKKLSLTRPFTQAEKEVILKWKRCGITEEMLSVMLDDTNRVSAMTIYKIDREVEMWKQNGLTTKDDVINFRQSQKEAKKAPAADGKTSAPRNINKGQIHFEGERHYDDEFFKNILNSGFDTDKK